MGYAQLCATLWYRCVILVECPVAHSLTWNPTQVSDSLHMIMRNPQVEPSPSSSIECIQNVQTALFTTPTILIHHYIQNEEILVHIRLKHTKLTQLIPHASV